MPLSYTQRYREALDLRRPRGQALPATGTRQARGGPDEDAAGRSSAAFRLQLAPKGDGHSHLLRRLVSRSNHLSVRPYPAFSSWYAFLLPTLRQLRVYSNESTLRAITVDCALPGNFDDEMLVAEGLTES